MHVSGESMLAAVGDSDVDTMSEVSSETSVPRSVNLDDSQPVVVAPDELSEQNSAQHSDAKDKSIHCTFLLFHFYFISYCCTAVCGQKKFKNCTIFGMANG